ncbi:hypothetical protein [Hyphococcus sp.]|uniref:hypothetical protein n=1 Tax=Hyphococcus sp. TaxID=2038636 RepID=UPI003CCC2206
MCAYSKQFLNAAAKIAPAITIAGLTMLGAAQAQSAGGVSIGDGAGGITDRAYVAAPPNFLYVVEKERGSFLDCGEGQDRRATDEDGRDVAFLRCGVTLTETVVIPAAATSARITIHY